MNMTSCTCNPHTWDLRLEASHEFEANLDYRVRPCLKKGQKERGKEGEREGGTEGWRDRGKERGQGKGGKERKKRENRERQRGDGKVQA